MKNLLKSLLILLTITFFVSIQSQYYLASGSLDGTVKVWNPEKKKKLVKTLFSSEDIFEPPQVNAVALSPNGKYLACGLNENQIKIWDTENLDKEPITLKLLKNQRFTYSLSFSRDSKLLAIGTQDRFVGGNKGTMMVYDLEAKKIIAKREVSTIRNLVVVFDEKGVYFQTFKRLGFWDYKKNKIKLLLQLDVAPFFGMDYKSPFLVFFTLLFEESTLGIINEKTKKALLFKIPSLIRSIALSPDARFLTYTSPPEGIVIIDRKKKIRRTFKFSVSDLAPLAFSPDGKYLVCGADTRISMWKVSDLFKKKKLSPKIFKGHTELITSLSFSFTPEKVKHEKQKKKYKLKDFGKRIELFKEVYIN